MKKLYILFLTFILTGCLNYKEVNDLGIATAIGIDKVNDNYTVSLSIASINQFEEKESKVSNIIYTGSGKTIYEASENADLSMSKQLYLNHIALLVISEDVAKDGLNKVIDFLFRDPQVRNEFKIVIASKNSANDILKIAVTLNSIASQNTAKKLSNITDINTTSYNKLFKILLEQGINPIIPTIYIVDEQNGLKSHLKIGPLAIFKEDKLLKVTTEEETEGINFINQIIKKSGIPIKYNNGYVVVETTETNSNITYDLTNDIPKINVFINTNATIQEVSFNLNLNDQKVLTEIENKSKEKIIEYVNKALTIAQNNNSDIFGFGNKIYKKNYNYWNKIKDDWENEIFSNLKINVDAKVTVKNKGTINTTIKED